MKKAAFVVIAMATAAQAGTITGTVDAKPTKYLKDTIVYIKHVDGKTEPKTVEVDQKGMEFVPHIVLLVTGDSVKFQNHDKVDHSVFSTDGGYDLGAWGPGADKDHKFTTEGVFAQVCKLHPEMLAYVFVGQNRFAATVDANGAFSIAGVPSGSYELDVWNPKLKGAAQKITVGDGATNVKITIAR